MSTYKTRPDNPKRGDSWRSSSVHRCEVCHTKTNRVIMGGWPGMGPRILCPGDEYAEHDKLEKYLEKCSELNEEISQYEQASKSLTDKDRKKARALIDDLNIERKLLEASIEQLRAKFQGLDDVEGVDEDAEVVDYYPQARLAGEKKRL